MTTFDFYFSIADNMEKAFDETVVVWKTFTLTYIEYPEDDVWGKSLAILSLAPLIIVIMFLTFFAAKRDMHTLTFGIGTILNGCINVFLKHTFKESRPEESLNRAKTSKLWEQYGWPSSHSQFMFFVSSYLVLFVLFRLNHAGASLKNRFLWLLTLLAAMSLAAIVAYGRVYLGYHSQNQVYWGGGIGAGWAFIWFLLTQFVLSKWYSWLCSTRLFEFFLIRDYSDIPNVMWFDYFHANKEAKTRNRKKSFKTKAN